VTAAPSAHGELDKAVALLDEAEQVCLACHVRPDADAQGPAADRWRVVLALHREARRRALRGLEDGAHPAAFGLKPKTLAA